MRADHAAALLLVAEIRALTERAAVHAIDHPRWRELVAGLEAHALELERSIRLEHDELFPAALALEARLRG